MTDTATPTSCLTISNDGPVRILVLDRPQRRNALDTGLAVELLQALRQADADPSVGAVLIAGAGVSFCAGADLGEFKGERANLQAQERRSDLFLELQLVFGELDMPVVCAVAGAAIGAGASIAIAADLTVMGEGAKLSYPETIHGMVPGLMIGHLQRRVGRKKAFELLALGQPVTAAQALDLGLVNQVVADTDVLTAAVALAQALAAMDRQIMRETKRLFIDLADLPLESSLRAARLASSRRTQA